MVTYPVDTVLRALAPQDGTSPEGPMITMMMMMMMMIVVEKEEEVEALEERSGSSSNSMSGERLKPGHGDGLPRGVSK